MVAGYEKLRLMQKLWPVVKNVPIDLNWSQKLVDIAGDNFDILGCHNYEYEPENFQSGLQRISDYLVKLDHFIQQFPSSCYQDRRAGMEPLPFIRLACGFTYCR